jgi:prevent-host-death family protein
VRTMSAKEAKNRFGELLLEAQRGPVTIEKNGRPVAVLQSFEEHQQVERLKLDWLRAAVADGLADVEAGRVRDFDEALFEEIVREGRSPLDD